MNAISLTQTALQMERAALSLDLSWLGGFGQGAVDGLLTAEGRILGAAVRDGEKFSLGEAVTRESIQSARLRMRPSFLGGLWRGLGVEPPEEAAPFQESPILFSQKLSSLLRRPVYLKVEGEQPGGAFSIRGASYFLLKAILSGVAPKTTRLVTASLGNYGISVARAAAAMGFPAPVTVFVPTHLSADRVGRFRNEKGLEIAISGDSFLEAESAARDTMLADPRRTLFVPAFDHSDIIIGNGTVGLEIGLQMATHRKDSFAVIVPSGGGLLAGVATYFARDRYPVYGVESRRNPFLSQLFLEHHTTRGGSVDGRARSPWHYVLQNAHNVVGVPQEENEAASAYLWEAEGLSVSPHGASPVAAVLFGGLGRSIPIVGDHWPLVLVLTSGGGSPSEREMVLTRYGDGKWPEGVLPRVYEGMAERGYLNAEARAAFRKNGMIDLTRERPWTKNIMTVGEGIDLVDLLVELVPPGWDLIDLLERIDLGPWREEEKDINASLRSMGQYKERWHGVKGESLFHPLANRGGVLLNYLHLMEGQKVSGKIVAEKFQRIHPRVVVETYINDLYLQRPDWIARLWPEATPERRKELALELRTLNDRVKTAVTELARSVAG